MDAGIAIFYYQGTAQQSHERKISLHVAVQGNHPVRAVLLKHRLKAVSVFISVHVGE